MVSSEQSSSTHYDYVVIGCGTMGSMALWQLTELAPDAKILGLEKYGRVHTKGSYAGESRLFRVALKEGGIFVPLIKKAREMWLELNERTGRDVFLPVGAVSVAPADFKTMVKTLEVIEEFDLDHEVLNAEELAERYPAFSPAQPEADEDIAIVDPQGGGIRPELAVALTQQIAIEAGAELLSHTEVTSIKQGEGPADSTLIETNKGTFSASKVIVTNGSWAADLYPDLADDIKVHAIPLTWYVPLEIEDFLPENLPIFMRDVTSKSGDVWHCYGAPSIDGYSVKVSHGNFEGEAPTPDTLTAFQTGELSEALSKILATRSSAFFNGMLDDPARLTIHHDGFTADQNPIIDFVPGSNRSVALAVGMSGYGMKFAPIYGRMVAELAVHGASDLLPEGFDYPVEQREDNGAAYSAHIPEEKLDHGGHEN